MIQFISNKSIKGRSNMKNAIFTRNLITSIFTTILLIYFMLKTTSPKIIFIPFLICSIAMAIKSISLLAGWNKIATVFDYIFKGGFFLFWFGFLIGASYIALRDNNLQMLIFSLPFWLIGLYFLKNKFLKTKPKKEKLSSFNFPVVISAILVTIAFLSGIALLIMGFVKANKAIIFGGAFFTFVSFTFVLFALTVSGRFDKFKTDILGLYVGILFIAIGIGIPAFKYTDTLSLAETVKSFGFWLFIPIMMIVAGMFQIIKCLRSKEQ